MTGDEDISVERLRGLRLLGLVGSALAILLGMFAPQGAAFWRIPERLQADASAALLAAGLPGVEVSMEGQHARLSGILADEAEQAGAARAVLGSAGPGGLWAGGVTGIDGSGLRAGAIERPFSWSARMEETRFVLAGAAPSEATAAELAAAAARIFPNREIVNQMHVAGGAPSPDFRDVARTSIERLGGLNSGQVRFVDTQIVFIGDGGQAGVDALKRAFATPPAPFKARIDVTIDGLDPDHPELQGLDLSSGDPEDCAQGFARMMEQNVINFATGSAAIDPSSRRVLDSLVSVAVRCDRFSIEVVGYTDNEGVRADNMELSSARANAVADYFAAHGVARERLGARGYGPDRPRASNATEAGRAANRRIEFNVSG